MMDFRRIASVAALVGAAAGLSMGGAEIMPSRSGSSTRGAFGGGYTKRNRARASGSKLQKRFAKGHRMRGY
jgi:hypothetical protein